MYKLFIYFWKYMLSKNIELTLPIGDRHVIAGATVLIIKSKINEKS